MEKCLICLKDFNILGKHITQKHDISCKEYYDKFLKIDSEGKCSVCGGETIFNGLFKDGSSKRGYRKHCCNSCAQKNKDTQNKIINTIIKNNGYNNRVEKLKDGLLKKYGVTNSAYIPEVAKKISERLKANKIENSDGYKRWVDGVQRAWSKKTKQETKEIYNKRIKGNPEIKNNFIKYARSIGYENISQKYAKTFDEFKNEIYLKTNRRFTVLPINNDERFVLSKCKKVEIKCSKCEGVFARNAYNFLKQEFYKCPLCEYHISFGEKILLDVLNEEGIKVSKQKTFNECKNPITNRKLKFDFYLDDFNAVIEYDGEVHYECSRFDNLEGVHYRDKIKNVFCDTNNIDILRVPYYRLKFLKDDVLEYIGILKAKKESK